jgi:hypothetical protein
MVNLYQNILTTDEQCSIRCVPPAFLQLRLSMLMNLAWIIETSMIVVGTNRGQAFMHSNLGDVKVG